MLAGANGYFRYLKYGLSLVLVFIGGKMLALFWDIHVSSDISLSVVIGILVISVLASLLAARFEKKTAG